MKRILGTLSLSVALIASCREPVAPVLPDRLSPVGLVDGVDGRVLWRDIEGGFWAIETADGRRLDPHASLPVAFRQRGLRVHVAAQPLPQVACIHMAGIIVEITAIRSR